METETKKPPAQGMPTLAHDLNNILMIIAGYADVLIAEHPNSPIVGDLQEIRRAVRRGAHLTAEVASFGSMRSARYVSNDASIGDLN